MGVNRRNVNSMRLKTPFLIHSGKVLQTQITQKHRLLPFSGICCKPNEFESKDRYLTELL